MHLQALLAEKDSRRNCTHRPWSEQVCNPRSGTGARVSSIQPRLSGASLLALFIRRRNSYITGSLAELKIKVWLPQRVTGSGLLTCLKHIHPSQTASVKRLGCSFRADTETKDNSVQLRPSISMPNRSLELFLTGFSWYLYKLPSVLPDTTYNSNI